MAFIMVLYESKSFDAIAFADLIRPFDLLFRSLNT